MGIRMGVAKSSMVALRHAADINATARVIVSDAEQDERKGTNNIHRGLRMRRRQNRVTWVLQRDDAELKQGQM
jgi:hypothetical protein